MISHIAQKVLLTETMLICCWVALIRNADATVLVTLLSGYCNRFVGYP
jgi:glyoxylate utilization-related uncharacterized protein